MEKNVLSKLYKGEMQVELAIVDDIKEQTKNANDWIKAFLASYKIIDAQKSNAIIAGEGYYKNADELVKKLQQFEIKAKELGVNPNENPEYKAAQDLIVRYDIQAVFDKVDGLRKIK